MPAVKDFDADSVLGKPSTKNIPATGEAKIVDEGDGTEEQIITKVSSTKQMEMLAFLEEPVQILVLPSQNEQDPKYVQLSINGRSQYIMVDEPITVKRKYVRQLARMRKTKFRQQVTINPISGEPINRMIPRTALRHNFTVLHDANPKGAAWLAKILKESV